MIPGEVLCAAGDITLNADRTAITLMVANTGDRPVQVGTTTLPKPTPRSTLTAPPRVVTGWTSPPAPPCALNPVNAAKCN